MLHGLLARIHTTIQDKKQDPSEFPANKLDWRMEMIMSCSSRGQDSWGRVLGFCFGLTGWARKHSDKTIGT